MAIRIFNTLTGKKEEFKPLNEGKVNLYVCGPTVYDDCHIGHLMGPVLFDAIARWLKAIKYDIRFVVNITDIDDKIIDRALKTGENWKDITQRYTDQYRGLLQRLHVETITDFPHCTDYISQMIEYVQDLIRDNRAYEIDDGVYYEVQKQPKYGKLSKRSIDDMLAGTRIQKSSDLKHPADFCLWKKAKPDEPSWDSPWGMGRPGWHLECSVMSTRLLGKSFDIHGGGDDLKFPHHENEIAQCEAHGDSFANYWMHNGLSTYEGSKVSKSDPRMQDPDFARQFQGEFLVETYGGATLRFFLLQGHYRRPSDFLPKNISSAQQSLQKLHQIIGSHLTETGQVDLDAIISYASKINLSSDVDQFINAMNDDFNTAAAIGHLFNLSKKINKLTDEQKQEGILILRDLGRHIGLFQIDDAFQNPALQKISPDILTKVSSLLKELDPRDGADAHSIDQLMEHLIVLRQESRAKKDFATSDKIRDQLKGIGIIIKDSPSGSEWSLEN